MLSHTLDAYLGTPLAASLYHTPLEIAPDQPFRRQRQGASMCGVKFYVESKLGLVIRVIRTALLTVFHL